MIKISFVIAKIFITTGAIIITMSSCVGEFNDPELIMQMVANAKDGENIEYELIETPQAVDGIWKMISLKSSKIENGEEKPLVSQEELAELESTTDDQNENQEYENIKELSGEETEENTGVAIILILKNGIGQFYSKKPEEEKYKYCETLKIFYETDEENKAVSIMNAGKNPISLDYEIDDIQMKLIKKNKEEIYDEEEQTEKVYESMTVMTYTKIPEFNLSEDQIQIDCSAIESYSEENGVMAKTLTRAADGTCGPWNSSYLKDLRDFYGTFSKACQCHDSCFNYGNSTYGYDWRQCNSNFHYFMILSCYYKYPKCKKRWKGRCIWPNLKHYQCVNRANLYKILVGLGGNLAWVKQNRGHRGINHYHNGGCVYGL